MGGWPQRAHRRLRVIARTAAAHTKDGFAWRDHRCQILHERAAFKHPGMQSCWSTWALRPRPRYCWKCEKYCRR